MSKEYFLKTERIGFSKWKDNDLEYAKFLWGNPEVTRYICANGIFSHEDIINRLNREIDNDNKYHVQYWPIFELDSCKFIGCCGLRPYDENIYEIGFHLCPEFWGQEYASEAANRVIEYAFNTLHVKKLFAGHHPHNIASSKLLHKLGFVFISDEYYEPTGLYHPSYELINRQGK